jgi:hypothetical protein
MLMPAGRPDDMKVRTSRLVKSGLKNLSFSKSAGQGSLGMRDSAAFTKAPNARVRSALTMATKPRCALEVTEFNYNASLCCKHTFELSSHTLRITHSLDEPNV